MRVLKTEWLPNCTMKRIITHWTAGSHKASNLDKEHYHFLIESDGTVVRGSHDVCDNVSTGDGDYAAHTLGCNTGSIGVSVCCMAGAAQSPFKPGSHPMTTIQWDRMAEVCADLCEKYDIQVTKATVLGHGEVQRILGITQRGKWDPMVLPWNLSLSPAQVGDAFRAKVQGHLDSKPKPATEVPPTVKARILGIDANALLADGTCFVQLRPIAFALGWTINAASGNRAKVTITGVQHELDFMNVGGLGFVEARDIATALNKSIMWDAVSRLVKIG